MAIVGNCASDEVTMLRTATRLESFKTGGAIPFVIDCGNGRADYGYASHSWIIDLYSFAVNEGGPVPQQHRGRLLGLLLGYSPEAIARFDETSSNRILHIQTNKSVAPASM